MWHIFQELTWALDILQSHMFILVFVGIRAKLACNPELWWVEKRNSTAHLEVPACKTTTHVISSRDHFISSRFISPHLTLFYRILLNQTSLVKRTKQREKKLRFQPITIWPIFVLQNRDILQQSCSRSAAADMLLSYCPLGGTVVSSVHKSPLRDTISSSPRLFPVSNVCLNRSRLDRSCHQTTQPQALYLRHLFFRSWDEETNKSRRSRVFLFWNPSKVDAVRCKGSKTARHGAMSVREDADCCRKRHNTLFEVWLKVKRALTMRTGAHDRVHIQNLHVVMYYYIYFHSTTEICTCTCSETHMWQWQIYQHSLLRLWVCRKHFRLPLGVPTGSIHKPLMSLWQQTDLHSEADWGLGHDVRLVWTLCYFWGRFRMSCSRQSCSWRANLLLCLGLFLHCGE